MISCEHSDFNLQPSGGAVQLARQRCSVSAAPLFNFAGRGVFRKRNMNYKTGTNEQKRMLFRTYIRRMKFDPENNKINVVFYPPYLAENIKRGNNLPRNISIGAAGGT